MKSYENIKESKRSIKSYFECNSKRLPFISIVIPVKNEEKYIDKCLSSIFSLDYPRNKYEIIVVDNLSADKTRDLVSRYDAVTLLVKAGTIGKMRNDGARVAVGELLAFIDADCIPSPSWLLRAVHTMNNHPHIGVVGGVISLEEDSSSWIEEYWINYLASKYHKELQGVETISSFCFVIKRHTMIQVRGFNEELTTCEDSDLGYRITQSGTEIVVNKNIKVNHLRNAKNAKEFFNRQLWQGGSNIDNLFLHRLELSELPSILIPICYLIVALCFVCSLFVSSMSSYRVLFLSCLLLVPSIITLSSPLGRANYHFFGYYYIWFLYLTARGAGMIIRTSNWKS